MVLVAAKTNDMEPSQNNCIFLRWTEVGLPLYRGKPQILPILSLPLSLGINLMIVIRHFDCGAARTHTEAGIGARHYREDIRIICAKKSSAL